MSHLTVIGSLFYLSIKIFIFIGCVWFTVVSNGVQVSAASKPVRVLRFVSLFVFFVTFFHLCIRMLLLFAIVAIFAIDK